MKNLLGVSPSKRNHGTTRGKEKILLTSVSLQNRRDFLRILGEQRGKRGEAGSSGAGEREKRKCAGVSALSHTRNIMLFNYLPRSLC